MAVLRTTAEDRTNYHATDRGKFAQKRQWVLPAGPFWVHKEEQTGEITGDAVNEVKKLCKPPQLPPLDTVLNLIYAPEPAPATSTLSFCDDARSVLTPKELRHHVKAEWMPSYKAFATVFEQFILDKDAYFYRDWIGNLIQIDDAIAKGFVTVGG